MKTTFSENRIVSRPHLVRGILLCQDSLGLGDICYDELLFFFKTLWRRRNCPNRSRNAPNRKIWLQRISAVLHFFIRVQLVAELELREVRSLTSRRLSGCGLGGLKCRSTGQGRNLVNMRWETSIRHYAALRTNYARDHQYAS